MNSRVLVLVVSICMGVLYFSILLDRSTVISFVVSERGVVQNVGAIALLAASVFFALAGRRSRWLGAARFGTYSASYFLMAIAFLIGAGEELSWGQHLLGVEPPTAVTNVNSQDELTIHNLNVFQGGEDGELNPIDRLFFIAALTFTVGIPLVARLNAAMGARLQRLLPIAPLTFGILFVANFTASKLAESLAPHALGHAIVEIKEMNFSIVFAMIALSFAASEGSHPGHASHGRGGRQDQAGHNLPANRAPSGDRLPLHRR